MILVFYGLKTFLFLSPLAYVKQDFLLFLPVLPPVPSTFTFTLSRGYPFSHPLPLLPPLSIALNTDSKPPFFHSLALTTPTAMQYCPVRPTLQLQYVSSVTRFGHLCFCIKKVKKANLVTLLVLIPLYLQQQPPPPPSPHFHPFCARGFSIISTTE